MADLIDAVETVIYMLKDGTTGIGSTGYEVEDDNEDPVTILVSYKLSEEELKDMFGGSQDYDVILTVEKTNIEDQLVGLTMKEWKVEVTITIYVIDKWSEVGDNKKYLTASLVRSQATNALRKFIAAHKDLTSYGLSKWKSTNWKEEEDKNVRPLLYKCIVTTEVTSYYED